MYIVHKMWAKFRAAKVKQDGRDFKGTCRSFNVHEEYLSTLRTNSYADFCSKLQFLVNHPSSLCQDNEFPEFLEPGQENIPPIVDSAVLSKVPELKGLMLKYFEISAEASNICSHLLKSINNVHSSYQFIQQALINHEASDDDREYDCYSELSIFINLTNPFSNLQKLYDFNVIRHKYSSVLQHLKRTRRKVIRKLKLIKYFKKASGVFIVAACGLVAVAAIVVAAHTFTALIMAPALFSFPTIRCLKRKIQSVRFLRSGFLRRVGEQLDIAAKGTYILNRDFDTMSGLVSRVDDEMEHKKEMVRFCLERGEARLSLQVVRELKKSDVGFKKHVEELEEHVYLCLVTINKARGLVIKEMTKSSVKGLGF